VRFGPDTQATPDRDQLASGSNEVRAGVRYGGSAKVRRTVP
jgi:hypothetical protein